MDSVYSRATFSTESPQKVSDARWTVISNDCNILHAPAIAGLLEQLAWHDPEKWSVAEISKISSPHQPRHHPRIYPVIDGGKSLATKEPGSIVDVPWSSSGSDTCRVAENHPPTPARNLCLAKSSMKFFRRSEMDEKVDEPLRYQLYRAPGLLTIPSWARFVTSGASFTSCTDCIT